VFNNPLGRPVRLRRSPNVGRQLRARPGHPQLAVEGNTVSATLSQGRALARVTGPTVSPPVGLSAPATTPCTFTVRLVARSGTVPVSSAAFTVVDEQGRVHHPSVTAAGGSRLPQRLVSGRALKLTVKAVLPIGAGRLEWAPAAAKPLVAWDFDVELD
jgi:hypothetical protein